MMANIVNVVPSTSVHCSVQFFQILSYTSWCKPPIRTCSLHSLTSLNIGSHGNGYEGHKTRRKSALVAGHIAFANTVCYENHSMPVQEQKTFQGMHNLWKASAIHLWLL